MGALHCVSRPMRSRTGDRLICLRLLAVERAAVSHRSRKTGTPPRSLLLMKVAKRNDPACIGRIPSASLMGPKRRCSSSMGRFPDKVRIRFHLADSIANRDFHPSSLGADIETGFSSISVNCACTINAHGEPIPHKDDDSGSAV